MYKPFVLACNYALDELSRIDVKGLPQFEPERQIIFVHTSRQTMEPTIYSQAPRAKPDIVLFQWDFFAGLLSDANESFAGSPYSVRDLGSSTLGEASVNRKNYIST